MSAIAIGPSPTAARQARYVRQVPVQGGRAAGRPALTLVPTSDAVSSAAAGLTSGSRAAGAAAPTSAGPMRLTRRGRVVLSLLATLLALGAIFGGKAVADGPEQALEVRSHVIQPGETWWSLASDAALPGEDVRDVVRELIDLNGRSSAGLTAGQSVVLPVSR